MKVIQKANLLSMGTWTQVALSSHHVAVELHIEVTVVGAQANITCKQTDIH